MASGRREFLKASSLFALRVAQRKPRPRQRASQLNPTSVRKSSRSLALGIDRAAGAPRIRQVVSLRAGRQPG